VIAVLMGFVALTNDGLQAMLFYVVARSRWQWPRCN